MRLAVVSAILLIVAAGIPVVYGYFSARESITNKLRPGGSNIRIAETFTPPETIKPGDIIEKNVKVQNEGPGSCFVRIKVVFSDSLMEQYCKPDWNNTDFVYSSSDGYYYYKHVLDYDRAKEQGESTESLFTSIAIKEEAPEEKMKSFDVIVYAESYQAEEGMDYREAWEKYRRNRG